MPKDVDVDDLKQPVLDTKPLESAEGEGLYESLYKKERQKNKVLLLSTGAFLVLFMVALGFGLNAAGANHTEYKVMNPYGAHEPGTRFGGPRYGMHR